jgi:hypothetical protein
MTNADLGMTEPPARPLDPQRAAAAAILRAVADLIDDRPEFGLPSVHAHYILSRAEETPEVVTSIMTALPCQWHADLDEASKRGWVNLEATTGGSSVHSTSVTISAKPDAVCVPTGTKTVTTWAPQPALARLLTGDSTSADRP